MADHVRRQIVAAVATAVTGLTTTGANVFTNRFHRLDSSPLPALVIFSKSESSERHTLGGDLWRVLDLTIEGYVKTTTPDTTLDTIAKEVEVAMATDDTFGGLATDSYITSTEMELVEGDTPVGVISMTYRVEYRTLTTAPDSAT